MFVLENVKYRDILDIDRINIEAGLVTCIVGESGSGKTTLLRILNRMTSPQSGTITYCGMPLTSYDPVTLRRKVVMLAQSPAIFPGTVRDNLLAGLHFAEKEPASDEKLLAILGMVRLGKGLDDDAEKLSGGEKQRLALGRVILLDPEVFLLDEPSSALDEDTEQLIIEALVNHARATKKTLVMVTHSRQVARKFADLTIEIKGGKAICQEEG